MIDLGKFIVEVFRAVFEYVRFLKDAENKAAAANKARDFANGMRYHRETKDTRLLENAILAHCGRDGCKMP